MLRSEAVAPEAVTVAPVSTEPSALRAAGFRFVFCYWTLFILPYGFGFLSWMPPVEWAKRGIEIVLQALVLQVGVRVLHQPAAQLTRHPTGSGDTLFDYVQVLVLFALAVVATAIWTATDRSRSHPILRDWLRVAMRYCLALALLAYGFAKIIPTQFPFPRLEALLRPFGESSPMGLLWKFMGYSVAYNVFAGLVEAAGGALLFWPQTTTLGALVAVAAMGNVVMLNFAYDVPVKLYSTHLLLMAVFLLAADARRLVDALVLNRATAPAPIAPLFRSTRLQRVAKVVKTVFVIGVAIQCATVPVMMYRRYVLAPKPSVYGLWSVSDFSRDGVEVPTLATDGTRWRRVIFTTSAMLVYRTTDQVLSYSVTYADADRRITVKMPDGGETEMSYTRTDVDHLKISGRFEGTAIDADLRRVPADSFPLVNRGFHWIQEYPFNR